MRRRTVGLIGSIVAGFLIAALTATAAPAAEFDTSPAQANADAGTDGRIVRPLGNCTWIFAIALCGRVRNDPASTAYLAIVNNWPPEFGTIKAIGPGTSSTVYFDDTDGFHISSGCWGTSLPGSYYGPGWHRIDNLTDVTVRVSCQ